MRYIKLFMASLMVIVASGCTHKKANDATVIMETTAGTITLKLYDETPVHRDNFIELAGECYFDSLLFHRVIPGFMIQGGDPDSKYAPAGVRLGEGGPDYRLNAEIRTPEIFHKRGALAAAREGDDVNPAKMSSPSQFYIVYGKVYTPRELESLRLKLQERTGREIKFTKEQIDTYTTIGGVPFLDGEYTVFGEVLEGLDVVEKIQSVECDEYDRPINDVRILYVRVETNK